jgi:hypothetical protein
MTPENFERTLREFRQCTPFQPFVVELVYGERFLIDSPEALALRGGVAVFIDTDGTPTLFDHENTGQITTEPPRQEVQP